MIYQPKFNLGDKVFHIINLQRPEFVECPMCKGMKTISINGETDRCPKCYGRGGDQTWVSEGWRVARYGREDRETRIILEFGFEQLTICQIRLEHTKGSFPEWTVMCKETGVGSGTIHQMGHLFETVEEAQSACDKLNSDSLT